MQGFSLEFDQLLELFVVLCTLDHIRFSISKYVTASSFAKSKSGPVKRDSMPTFFYALITPLQLLACFLLPLVYVVAVVSSQLKQPPWMRTLALPNVSFGVVSRTEAHFWKDALRVLGCAISVFLKSLSRDVLAHLGDQYHYIGRRENQRIVQTGPYAHVRHPLYSSVLLQELSWILMYWSYAPLISLVATAAVFAVKIPMEEAAIQRNEKIKNEYRAYMRKVPARVVPDVW